MIGDVIIQFGIGCLEGTILYLLVWAVWRLIEGGWK